MLLVHRKTGKKILILNKEKDYNTEFGIIKKEDLQKAKEGDIIKTHLGEEFIVLEERFVDKIEKIRRGPQITHPKDIGMIISYTGLSSGWRVVELGTGTGMLTVYLANVVKPDGHVYSYEIREDFLKIAEENLKFLGLENYVTLKLKDCREGIDEKEVDLVISDFRDPWNALEHIYNALRIGGFYVALFPNILQVYELIEKACNYFKLEKIFTVHLIEWVYKKSVLRPKNMQLYHTEFIIIFRKI